MAAVPGDPPDADSRVRVILDPDDPTKSIAVVPHRHPPTARLNRLFCFAVGRLQPLPGRRRLRLRSEPST